MVVGVAVDVGVVELELLVTLEVLWELLVALDVELEL